MMNYVDVQIHMHTHMYTKIHAFVLLHINYLHLRRAKIFAFDILLIFVL